ncbi:hypothetical protein, partial [Xanthobacter versatilis]|uniref:hypothetical protein n=1 Tax=Xanthobacter autotrophicus (strain ATCC BAA-1158 / Py2) TaxID=78245 RepID=UPI003727B2D1
MRKSESRFSEIGELVASDLAARELSGAALLRPRCIEIAERIELQDTALSKDVLDFGRQLGASAAPSGGGRLQLANRLMREVARALARCVAAVSIGASAVPERTKPPSLRDGGFV